jgi:hypothetical protein
MVSDNKNRAPTNTTETKLCTQLSTAFFAKDPLAREATAKTGPKIV